MSGQPLTFTSHDDLSLSGPVGHVTKSHPTPPTQHRGGLVSESSGDRYGYPQWPLIINGGGYGFGPGDDSMSGRYGGFWPADRLTQPNHAPAGVYTEQQLFACQAWSRWLCERNMLGVGFLNTVRNFIGPMAVQIVKRGQAPGAASSGPQDADGDGEPDVAPEVAKAQQFWDNWRELFEWGEGVEDRERELETRLIRDGEVFVRVGGGGEDGGFVPWARFIDPEFVRNCGDLDLPPDIDPDDVDYGFGVLTSKADPEHVYGYCVVRVDDRGGEFVPAKNVIHAKANVDRTVKRGVPDFMPVEGHLAVVEGLFANMGDSARKMSGIAWREVYATAPGEQVRTLIGQDIGQAYGPGRPPIGPAGGKLPVRNHDGTVVMHTEAGRQMEAGPTAVGASSFTAVADATLRAVSFRFAIPDWFAGSADGFASALVTGSPFVLEIQSRQNKVAGLTRVLVRRLLALAEASGVLPPGAAVKPLVTARPVVIADEEKKARTFLSLFDKNLADPIKFIKETGGDPKQLAANLAAWQAKFPPGGQPPQGGDAGPGQGALPTPAPPGSAGGDGSSPQGPEAVAEADLSAAIESGSLTADEYAEAEAGGLIVELGWVEEAATPGKVPKKITVTTKKGTTFTKTVMVNPAVAKAEKPVKAAVPAPAPKVKAEPKAKPAKPPAPPTPAERKAAAHDAVKAALADPENIDLAAIAGHLKTLTVADAKGYAKAAGVVVGSRDAKAKLHDKILDHLAKGKAGEKIELNPSPAAEPNVAVADPGPAPPPPPAPPPDLSKELKNAVAEKLVAHAYPAIVGEMWGMKEIGAAAAKHAGSVEVAAKIAAQVGSGVTPAAVQGLMAEWTPADAGKAPEPKYEEVIPLPKPPAKPVGKDDKAGVESAVKAWLASEGATYSHYHGADAKMGVAAGLKKAGFVDKTVGYFEIAYALNNIATQKAAALMPPMFAKNGAKNAKNPALPSQSQPTLAEDEAVAVQKYTGSAYADLNRGLRKSGQPPGEYADMHKSLQSAFKKAGKIDPPVTVKRGMKMAPADAAKFAAGAAAAFKAGSPVTMPGYISTSVSDKTIDAFKGNVNLTIKATHGIDCLPYTHYPHEKEMLLNHDCRYKVASVSTDKNGNHNIQLEQIHPDDYSPSNAPTGAPLHAKPGFLGKLKGWFKKKIGG